MRRTPVFVAVLVLVVACAPAGPSGADPDAGPNDPDGAVTPDPDGGTTEQAERSCETVFRYRQPAGSVQLAGEWDWESRIDLTLSAGGDWLAGLELPEGTHAYKLIVDNEWILDPEAGYRTYSDGVENSAVIVGDCTEPLLEPVDVNVTEDSADVELRVLRGNGGPEVTAIAAEVVHDFTRTPAEATLAGGTVTVELDGLEPGKYTVEVTAMDAGGGTSELVRLPFWVEDRAFDWRSPIYMVMIDRFRNGNPGNDPEPTSASPSADWHGGDLAGITAAIEEGYFEALGIEVLWLSPFQTNPEIAYAEGEHAVSAYHGYWPTRARELDPRYGTEAELEALVKAAHDRGIRVLMDFVINHVHEDHEYFASNPDWFRTGCECGTDNCGWTERRLDCLFREYMPDVNWQNRAAADAMVDDALWWLTRFDLDGLRVDAVKHVEDAAVANLATRIHRELEQAGTEYFLLGETAMGWVGHTVEANQNEYDTISRYIGHYGLNGQFDFVLYHAVSYNVFAYDTYGLLHADFWAKTSLEQYPDEAIMTPYVGSHDSQRFITLASQDPNAYHKWPEQGLPGPPTAEAFGRARVAFTWVLTQPGAPLLYYGDEYGEYGGSDPDNRHMWRPAAQRNASESALFDVIQRVGAARAGSAALRLGEYTTLLGEEGVLAYARHTADDVAIVVLNHTADPQTRSIDVSALAAVPASFTDRITDTAIPVTGGAVELTLPPRSSAVLTP